MYTCIDVLTPSELSEAESQWTNPVCSQITIIDSCVEYTVELWSIIIALSSQVKGDKHARPVNKHRDVTIQIQHRQPY